MSEQVDREQIRRQKYDALIAAFERHRQNAHQGDIRQTCGECERLNEKLDQAFAALIPTANLLR